MPNDLSRRTFLKIMGLTGAAAAGCGKPPSRELMPYVIPDENVIPGVPAFYSAMCSECAAGCGVVARVREGRVIKLEGNPQDPINAGALCARGQAALQGLYHPDRLRQPQQRRHDGVLEPIAWEAALHGVAERLRAAQSQGADRVAFIGPPYGPTLERVTGAWLQAWGSQRLVRYEAFDERPARAAAQRCFGRGDLPVYHLDAAAMLLSFGADFLETWRSPVEFTRQYAARRVPHAGAHGAEMLRAVYVGPRLNLTAANCDEWVPARPGTEPAIAWAILHAVARHARFAALPVVDAIRKATAAYAPAAIAAHTGIGADVLERIGARFAEADGAVALAGSDDEATHVAAFVMNALTGNLGRTVGFLEPAAMPAPPPAQELSMLIAAMQQGSVDVLVIADVNPVFSVPAAAQFSAALQHVPLVVWCGGVPDETADRAQVLLPIHHALETWGDAAPRPGVTLLGQPVMQSVHDTLPLGDVLLASARLGGVPADQLPWNDTAAAVAAAWRQLHADRGTQEAFEVFWEEARRAGGVFQPAAAAAVQLRPEALQVSVPLPQGAPGQLTAAAFPHVFFFDGRGADKPWLQEIPEPVSQIVWDTWADIHEDTAKRLGVAENDVIELQSPHGRVTLPVHVSHGVARDVVAVPIGQGHTSYGRYARQRGANVWQLLPVAARAVPVELRRTGTRYRLVFANGSSDMRDRSIVEAMSLRQLRSGITPTPHDEVPEPFEIRPAITYPKHQWGMTIDLSACTGCSACVAACYAENNLPIVGKERVGRGEIMSWMRIDRYVPDRMEAPLLYLAPMLCQHCDHAPCEPVCPVYASYHTDEGLNGQVYNRCIGTRYCENNCPYKVRRFNWYKPEWPAPLHLQLNPDVTTRGMGVMEKCTFCIQRIRAAEMDAADQDRPVRDGEIVPACAQACPAGAITFGDRKDPHSAMMRRRAAAPLRRYRALEELNTDPAIVYLREVFRGPDEV